MPKIKTRDAVGKTIKTLDKSRIASEKMKSEYIKAKRRVDSSISVEDGNQDEYAANRAEEVFSTSVSEAVWSTEKNGSKGINALRERAAKDRREKQAATFYDGTTVETGEGYYPQESTSKGREILKKHRFDSQIKTREILSGNMDSGKNIKSAEQIGKRAIKNTREVKQTAYAVAQASEKSAEKAYQAAKETAKATKKGLKAAARATRAAIKGIISAAKALVSAIVAGGWTATTIIVVICLIGLLANSAFGIFFSGEPMEDGQMVMQDAVRQISYDYDLVLQETIDSIPHDILEMEGEIPDWKEVVALYAVKVNTIGDDPQEVATMDEEKQVLLAEVFWDMTEILTSTETITETVTTETTDENGNTVEKETTITKIVLHVDVSHLSLEEMMHKYSFDEKQIDVVKELLEPANKALWIDLLGVYA